MSLTGTRSLRVIASLILLAPGFSSAGAAEEDLATAESVAQVIAGPDFELLGLDGARHRLADARGKVLLVNFWATWCTACRTEIPQLNELADEFSEELVVYGIATDIEGGEKVVPYAEELEIDYPVLLDPKAVSTSLFGGLEGYPMTFIFDREGLIYSSYLGAQDKAIFRADVEYLLSAEPSPGEPLVND